MPDYSLTPSRATWRDRAVLVLLALYWLALVLGTHTPTTPRTTGLPMSDKVVHFGAYAGLATLAYYALRRRGMSWSRAFIVLWGVLALHAVLDEVTQGAVPGRSPDPLDALADLSGVTVALAFWRIVELLFSARQKA